MSDVIQLMKEAELVAIRPLGLLARLDRGPTPLAGTNFENQFNLKTGFVREEETGFSVVFFIDCRSRKASTDRPFARFVYRAAVQYRAKQAFPDEVIMQFATTNAAVHIWPYARQFVHSFSTQLGLPPVLLPALRVGKPPGSDAVVVSTQK